MSNDVIKHNFITIAEANQGCTIDSKKTPARWMAQKRCYLLFRTKVKSFRKKLVGVELAAVGGLWSREQRTANNGGDVQWVRVANQRRNNGNGRLCLNMKTRVNCLRMILPESKGRLLQNKHLTNQFVDADTQGNIIYIYPYRCVDFRYRIQPENRRKNCNLIKMYTTKMSANLLLILCKINCMFIFLHT